MRLRWDRQPRPGRPGDRGQALIATHGGTETIVMRLDLESVADNAALIIPTPTPATARTRPSRPCSTNWPLSAPRVRPGRNNTDLDEVAAAPGAAPVVVLGATRAAGSDHPDRRGSRRGAAVAGLARLPPAPGGQRAKLDPYLRQGWSFVAMRLTGEKPLSGQIDPVKLQFVPDRLGTPMRMSAAARIRSAW